MNQGIGILRVVFVSFLLHSFSFCPSQLCSQIQELVFEHYSTDDGLSSPIVRSVIQDKTGYLWFATYGGLDRYDGVSFKSCKNIPGDTSSITNGFVQCLLELHPDRNNLTHYRYDPNDSETIIYFAVNSIYREANEAVWIAAPTGLLNFETRNEQFGEYYVES